MTRALADWPMTFFDVESSGVSMRDRIVTAALVDMTPIEGSTPLFDEKQWLLDPGIPIPEAASNIHGITTDRARADGMEYAKGYAEIRRALDKVAASRVLVGFNVSFDLGMIHWEGLRLGYPPYEPGYVVDPFVIDRGLDPYRRGKRRLVELCEFHKVAQYDAHSAFGDCMAAGRLAYKMLRSPGLANQFETMAELMVAQKRWHKQRQLSFIQYLEKQGEDASDVDVSWPVRGVV